ncbi:hypothetical protein GE061_017967 [Apolygus lucorum]|uniref:Uncharacterized protein n=1 Tax=Apolygus lucorum TaxID=248454 RepID=A0A8S9XEJ8_APOLU|nr:hypothetical protein GE061_017967 [Apolygus lucorum]
MPNHGLLYVPHERFKFHSVFVVRTLCKAISLIPPVVIPPIHIAVLYHYWHSYNLKVDRKRCECSCWDTVFKGPYETHIGSFKHLYFNATVNTLKIWISIVVGIIVLYETIKYLMGLGLKNQLRYSMLTLFISSIFSHYYTWWNYINYWNDEYYKQWNHQLYFTATELFSTCMVLKLANKQETFTRRKLLLILGISLVHIVAGCADQFIHNVFHLAGRPHQVVRDLAFMFGDALHLIGA